MAVARSWRQPPPARGPLPVTAEDVGPLNQVFSDAFTERYRRDGMVGVRVPFLNPAIWRYAIMDAGDGAMLWRGERDEIVAFNIAHRSGTEGWMGPLAVRPDLQGAGLGKDVVRVGVEWLKQDGATVIGLETMPRTMDNIGFYSRLGFVPGKLTLTLTLDSSANEKVPQLLGRLSPAARDDAIAECALLAASCMPGYDFTREILLTHELGLGDTVLVRHGDALVGFALCHTAPLVEGRVREELRVLKLAVPDLQHLDMLLRALTDFARRSACARAAFRVQGDYPVLYSKLVSWRARVRWTDLRMTVSGYGEAPVERGVLLSNWEI